MLLIGKDSERLINVAITRTRGKFIHVSNQSFIRKHIYNGKTLRQLVEHQVGHRQTVDIGQIGRWIQHQHPKLQWMHARKVESVFQDIEAAMSSIVISIPAHASLSREWKNTLRNRGKQVSLMVISKAEITEIQPDQWQNEGLSFPFIVIDDRVIWLGHLFEGASDVRPPFISVRLDSEKVSEYFLSQFLPIK
ncbi:hypothetical protein [Neobacillus sp. 19]|uniref:hypothetical protein n=1 Tax=Neobacillus sp. 19 TaxID=3394458 RepID=UPI003BF7245D